MATVKKFKMAEVASQIRHVERSSIGNKDIKKELQEKDYLLSPDRGTDSYNYFVKRLSEVYWLHRKDVVLMIGWVITAPKDLPPTEHAGFFATVYSFFATRYGEKNVITAVVHNDEDGMPHEHILIIPIVRDEDNRHPQNERVLCKAVINRMELRRVHPELQNALNEAGFKVSVMNGITARQGGNIKVREWKTMNRQDYEISFDHGYEFHFGRD